MNQQRNQNQNWNNSKSSLKTNKNTEKGLLRVLPNAQDLESAVLGAVLVDSRAYSIASEYLYSECFYSPKNELIWNVFGRLNSKNSPIDILTVTEELKSAGELEQLGGLGEITKLTIGVIGSTNITSHCKIVFEKYLQREVIKMGSELVEMAYDSNSDAFNLVEEAEKMLFNISQRSVKSDYAHLSDKLPDLLNAVELAKSNGGKAIGVPSGYPVLDSVTGGFQNGQLIIIAARPAVGKSVLSLNIAKGAASQGYPVGVFNLEMSHIETLRRAVANVGGHRMNDLKSGRIEPIESIYHTGQLIEKLPIYVDDNASLTVSIFRAKARKMVTKHKVKLIIIDYLQLMTGEDKRSNREQEISTISRWLKITAKELQIPIIALSQMSRDVEKRGNKEPQLSDLRESGAIEQDADIVAFIYARTESEIEEDIGLKNIRMLKIAKQRDGALETIAFNARNDVQTWDELGIIQGKNIPEPLHNLPHRSNDAALFFEPF